MEDFRKKVKARIRIGVLIVLIGTALIVSPFILEEYDNTESGVSDTWRSYALYLNNGMIFGLVAVGIFYILRNFAALKNEEKLKKLYIAETDERILLIHQKAGSIGINASITGLIIGTSVSVHFNLTVFFTLLSACLFVCLIKGVLKLYYHKKY